MNIKISIIIPVYNTEKFIFDCLNSVSKQSMKDIEIICINDGSTDRSLENLTSIAQKDIRIHIISQKHQGVSVARNTGIAAATGTYIQFLDSDDMLDFDTLSYAFQQMADKQLDVFYFDAKAIFESAQLETEKGGYKAYYHRKSHYQNVQTGHQLFTTLIKDGAFRPNGNLQMIRRDFLLKSGVRYIPGIVHEDNAFTAELMLHAKRVCHENKALYIRRLRPGSIMTKPQAFSNAYGYFRCAMAMEKYFFKPEFPENTQYALQIFCQDLLRSMETIYKNISEEEKAKIKVIPTEERGAMLYLCWYNEQITINKEEINKKNAECKVLQNDKMVLVKQNEDIQHKNVAYRQQIVSANTAAQTLRETLENQKNTFIQKLQKSSQEREILQCQLSNTKTQYEEVMNKNSIYEQQLAERNKAFHTLQADFLAMQHSLSFRVGRKLTWLPRKIRDRFLR